MPAVTARRSCSQATLTAAPGAWTVSPFQGMFHCEPAAMARSPSRMVGKRPIVLERRPEPFMSTASAMDSMERKRESLSAGSIQENAIPPWTTSSDTR